MPPYSELVQQNNPLLKRIYNLKFEKKEKDPTVINQAKRLAQEEVDKIAGKLTQTSKQSLEQLVAKFFHSPPLTSLSIFPGSRTAQCSPAAPT